MAADMIHPLEPHGVHITCTSLDIVGDIHGCMTELEDLLEQLDWHRDGPLWSHPDRLLVLVGDLVNRGPASWRVLEFAHAMQQAGRMVCVLGNHDSMLLRALNGEHMPWFPAIANTLQQRETLAQPELQSRRAIAMLRQTPLWATFGSLSSPELVVVHACWHPRIADIPEHLHEPMCVYGPVVTDGSIRGCQQAWTTT
ncbi:MAG: metallophosphoesterase, partial [Myxococcota bacterium]